MKESIGSKNATLILTILLILAGVPYYVGLGDSSLWDSNEAFYAETPREMIEAGDYINPNFNYEPRFNKPPLSYWVVAAFYHTFGVSERTARLPVALGGSALVLIALAIGRIAFSATAGLFAAATLAATPRFLMFSRRIIVDVYLAMFMGLVLLFFILAERRPVRRRLYLSLMYVATGLGMLTKGPVAAVLPALVFSIYLAASGRLRDIRNMMLPAGLIIIAIIVLPWYVAVYLEHGWVHISGFILDDNISRYTQAIWGPRRGFFFYVPVMLADLFPWSLFVVGALASWLLKNRAGRSAALAAPLQGRPFRRRIRDSYAALTRKTNSGYLLVLIWILTIVLFFSLSRSKEDLYILPVYAAVAALVGAILSGTLASQTGDQVRRVLVITGGILAVGGAGLGYLVFRGARITQLEGSTLVSVISIAGGIAVTCLGLFGRRFAATVALAGTFVAFNWVLVIRILPDFERFKPVRPLCEVISARASTAARIGYYKLASPSMVFYLRRPVFECFREEEIRSILADATDVYCLMTREDYEALNSLPGVSTYILATNPVLRVKWGRILDSSGAAGAVLVTNKSGASRSE